MHGVAVVVSWWREAVSDENGLGDIAYGGVASIIVAFVFVTTFECVMVAIAYIRGVPFDPLPLAQAFALIVGAVFSTGLAGLTAYMLATRKGDRSPQTVVAGTANVVQSNAEQPIPAEAATEVEPKRKHR
jgi:hypothetical protein